MDTPWVHTSSAHDDFIWKVLTSTIVDLLTTCPILIRFTTEYEEIMAKGKSITHIIDESWCKGCGICVHFCPKKVLELDSNEKAVVARAEDCIGCKLCELRCPDLAIQILIEEKE